MRIAACFIACVLSIAAANAQSRTPIDIAVEFIIGNCFHPRDDISRVKSAARLFKWEAPSADVLNLTKPVDAADFEGCYATYEGQHFFIGINRATFKGRPADVCAISVDQSLATVLPRILTELKIRKLDGDANALQVSETYEVEHPTQRRVIMNVLWAPDGDRPFTVSFIGIR